MLHNQSPHVNAVRGISYIFLPEIHYLKHYYDTAFNEKVILHSNIRI